MPTPLFSLLTRFPVLLAAGTPAPGTTDRPPIWQSLVPMLLIFGIFYMILIYPQQKKQKAHRSMVSSLGKGDKVITSGGIHGVVTNVKDNVVVVRIAENVRVEVSKGFVTEVVKSSTNGKNE